PTSRSRDLNFSSCSLIFDVALSSSCSPSSAARKNFKPPRFNRLRYFRGQLLQCVPTPFRFVWVLKAHLGNVNIANSAFRGRIGTQQNLSSPNRAGYVRPRSYRPCSPRRFQVAQAMPKTGDALRALRSKRSVQTSSKVLVTPTADTAKRKGF